MGWDEDRPQDEGWFAVDRSGRVEPEPEPVRSRRGRPSVLSILLGLVVVAIAVVAWINHSENEKDAAEPLPQPSTSTPSRSTPSGSPSSASPTPTVSATSITPPLGPGQRWTLYAASTGTVVRLDLATGEQTVTRVGDAGSYLQSLTLVPGGVVFQGEGPATFVADDGTTRRYSGTSPSENPVPIPGSRDHWALRTTYSEGGQAAYEYQLVGPDRKVKPGREVRIRGDLFPESARSDGGLALIVDAPDGVYRVEGPESRRITTGTFVARMPQGWLVNECDDRHRCRLAIVDRRTFVHTRVGGALNQPAGGLTSPDGKTVAAVVAPRESEPRLVLIDPARQTTRLVTEVSPYVNGPTIAGALAWSPDSSWLVVATSSGVSAVDPATGQVTVMPVPTLGDQILVAVRKN